MPGISKKKLAQIEKTLEAVFTDDEESLEAIQKSLAGFRAAIAKGETVTMDDLTEVLGEVVLEKMEPDAGARTAVKNEGGDEAVDPVTQIVAPAMLGLYKQLFDDSGTIRKAASADAQSLFDAAFQGIVKALLPEFDAAIEAAAEATAIELGKGGQVNFGKSGKKKPADADPDDDGDEDDMQKLLKALGVTGGASSAVIEKMHGMQARIDELETKNALVDFGKQAEEIGEGQGFGATLLKLHKIDPKLAAEIKKRLGAKNAVLKQANAWSEEIGGGEGGEAGASALQQLNAKATEMVSKGEKDDSGKKLTFAKAFTMATERHPELYQEYRAEEEAKRRR